MLARPDRSSANKQTGSYQDQVSRYLCSRAMSHLCVRHRTGAPKLSCSAPDVEYLAQWMTDVALVEFAEEFDYDTVGRSAIARLDCGKLLDGMALKAAWVLERWSCDRMEACSLGGKHGKWCGVRKGRVPRWSFADLKPFWDLPRRGRAKACMEATGMSSATFYKLAKGMPAFLARLELEAQEMAALNDEFAELLNGIDVSPIFAQRSVSENDDAAGSVVQRSGQDGGSGEATSTSDRLSPRRSPQRVVARQRVESASGRFDGSVRRAGQGHRTPELVGGGTATSSPSVHRGVGYPGVADDLRRHVELPHCAVSPGQVFRGRIRGSVYAGDFGDRDFGDGRSWWGARCRDRVSVEAGGHVDGAQPP